MSRKIILIGGYCATGKTSFSERLKSRVQIPCYTKDSVKEILAENIGFSDRTENKKLSNAAFVLLSYIAQQNIESNIPIIVESNFTPEEGDILRKMLEATECQVLTYLFTGDLKVIYDRFMEREQSDERHFAHKSNDFHEFSTFCEAMEPLAGFSAGGETIDVDMTFIDDVDYDQLIEIAVRFLQT